MWRSRTTATSAVCVGLVLGAGGPAGAQGDPVGGSGTQYFLNDAFTGSANVVFSYGEPRDVVFFGDWDGNGSDTPMVQRDAQFYVRNDNSSGVADYVFSYGNPGDTVLVGDWDGDGVDTLAVRRGATYFVKNSMSTGVADVVITYGEPWDSVLVGDWNGDGVDTLAVRRETTFFVKDSISTGVADYTFVYGNPGDIVLVGDWDGDGADTLAVRRVITYYLRNSTTTGVADVVFAYGNPEDTAFAGDWNGDRTDTLGVRRPDPTPPLPLCTYADIPTPFTSYSDWYRTLLDTAYVLPSSYGPGDLADTGAAGLNSGFLVRSFIIGDLAALAADARAAGAPLRIVSAYRSYSVQVATFERWVATLGYDEALLVSARPGHSEHQLGTTLDFASFLGPDPWSGDWATTTAGSWMRDNAWKYGFLMSYPEAASPSVTCYSYEPWHYRYVGRSIASEVHHSGLTLREYLWYELGNAG